MAGMILLVLVVDTCLTVSLAYRLSSTQRRIRRLACLHHEHENIEPEEEDIEF